MAARSKKSQIDGMLDRLEAAYGPLVPSEDPIEAGLMTLLAEHAPDLANATTRMLAAIQAGKRTPLLRAAALLRMVDTKNPVSGCHTCISGQGKCD